MFLYYQRPFVWFSDGHTSGLTVPEQEFINSADCLLHPTGGLPRNGSVESIESIDSKTVDIMHQYNGFRIFYYKYIDIKMCRVDSRKDAFKEVNLFLKANDLYFENTHVETINGVKYIIVWEAERDTKGAYKSYIKLVRFILSESELEIIPYERWRIRSFYMVDKDKKPSTPDEYFRKYLRYKEGL